MPRPAFLTQERVSRFVLAMLLMLGVLLPLLMLFGLGAQVGVALLSAVATLLLLNLATIKKYRWFAVGGIVLFLAVQLFLPRMGVFGAAAEALKAMALFFNKLPVVMPLFGGPVAGLLAVGLAFAAFLFSKKGAGFLPATIIVVLVLFGLWALGKSSLVWYTLPALVALLLIISQTAHEKISILNVLPMALAVALLALLLLPAGRVTIAPLEKAAFELKQRITDYLFFTEPRNVFTLSAYGYYPEGGSQLGGKAEPSEYPVMTVKTDRKTLLRAVLKDEYTGRSFRDTSSAKRYLYVNPRWGALRAKVFQEGLPSEAIRKASSLLDEKAVSVQMQNKATSTVFTPLFLRKVDTPGNMVPYFNDASELFITRDLDRDDHYTVFAPLFEGGDEGLQPLVDAALKDDKDYQAIYSQYTRLPSHLEQKVFTDVGNIIKNAQTPYDKATAIMRHLQKYYRYTLTPKDPPENQDFITYFLYVGKEGYCTYYAAAMTVMCRMAGLPSRYVEGFLAMPGGDGFAYVTGKDAHAWTEVYFEGFGWVPFDPTPSQQGAQEKPPEQEDPPPDQPPEDEPSPAPPPIPDEEDQPTPEPPEPDVENDTQQQDPTENPPPEQPPSFPWWILGLLAAAGAIAFRCHVRMPDRVAVKQKTEQDKLFIYGNGVNTLLRMRGRTPKRGETPLLFARRMDSIRACAAPLVPLWRAMALSNYSRKAPGKEQTQQAKQTFDTIYKAQPLLIKVRFLLAAAFGNRCYTGLTTVLAHEQPAPKTTLPGPADKGAKAKGGKKGKPGPKAASPKGGRKKRKK